MQESHLQEFAPSYVQAYDYPYLLNRIKALLIDGSIQLAVLIGMMLLLEDAVYRTEIMICSAVLIGLTYEPLLTKYSQTMGQRIMGIQVRKIDNPMLHISLKEAYLRWFFKGILGWLSFITIHSNEEHRAIHDLVSHAVMVNSH